MKKLFAALVLAVVLFVTPAYASDVQIQIMGMNWKYDGNSLFDAGGRNIFGAGIPAQSDPLTTVTFLVNGVEVGSLTSNIWFDSYIAVGTLPVTGTTTGTMWTGFGFDLLTQNATPGWGVELLINNYSITTTANGLRATLTGSFLDAGIWYQNLPFGIVLTDPVTVSFSGTIFNPVTSGGNYTSFTASGTGEIAASAVPAPAALLLFAPGLAGLAAMRRRMRK